jgi:hypothetical protein
VAHAFARHVMTNCSLNRTFEASGFNAVANHPDVKPWLLAPEGVIDLSGVIENPANYALWRDGGGFVLVCHEPGIYEAHSLFLPEARGHSIAAMRAGFEYMFVATDAIEIVTSVPDGNEAALALASKAGFKPIFRTDGMTHCKLDLVSWAMSRPELEDDGQVFHDALEQKKLRSGSTLHVHKECATHNRMVGAAFRMVKRGNAVKAVAQYNKWARMAGYAPIGLISINPPTIDVVDAIVEWTGQEMEVVLCR